MKRLELWHFAPLALLALPLLGAGDCCPINPVPNTVIAAHGNTDWHIDTAEEFLFGTDMAGGVTAANHAPAGWNRRHIHTGLTNTAKYYNDKDEVATGDDWNGTNGIDTSMLFFYAGHGSPTSWDTLGDHGHQTDMCLGDCPGGGMARYYWQCSCEVFAHGPRSCGGATWHYGCPGSFSGAADSWAHRNVYERWGPAIDPYLRMACGASTSAWCHQEQTNAIWNNYNNLGQDVSDSFINGLAVWGHVVPLCITRGGSNPFATPLFDSTFTNQANKSGNTHYWLQYLSGFAVEPVSAPASAAAAPGIPDSLPVFTLRAGRVHEALEDVSFSARGERMVSSDEIEGRPRVSYDPASGAIYFTGARTSAEAKPLDEAAYITRAREFLEQNNLSRGMTASSAAKDAVGEPVGRKMMIETAPIKGEGEAIQRQKNVTVSFRRKIDIDGRLIDVLGAGGLTEVRMNNDGSVAGASQVWREISGVVRTAAVKSYDEAYKEALTRLDDADAYKLDQWDWGYKEAAGNVEQKEMSIVFWFGFVPADPEALMEHPPRMVEIAGQQS